MNVRRRLVVSACVLSAALASAPAGQMPDGFPGFDRLRAVLPSGSISDVRIVGNLRWVSRQELKQAIAGRLRGGFFRVDIAAVREAALAVPWVRDVSVRRVWPGELHLTVVENWPNRTLGGRGVRDGSRHASSRAARRGGGTSGVRRAARSDTQAP